MTRIKFALFLFVLLSGCHSQSPDLYFSSLVASSARSVWIKGVPQPPAISVDDACRLAHKSGLQWISWEYNNRSFLACVSNGAPPLIFERTFGNKWQMVIVSKDFMVNRGIKFVMPPIEFGNLTALPKSKGKSRVRGLIINRANEPIVALWLRFVDGKKIIGGKNCVKRAVSEERPLWKDNVRVLDCSVANNKLDKVQVLVGLRLANEPAGIERVRIYTVQLSVKSLNGAQVLVSAGRAYKIVEDGKPKQPFELNNPVAGKVVAVVGKYVKVESKNGISFFVLINKQGKRAGIEHIFVGKFVDAFSVNGIPHDWLFAYNGKEVYKGFESCVRSYAPKVELAHLVGVEFWQNAAVAAVFCRSKTEAFIDWFLLQNRSNKWICVR